MSQVGPGASLLELSLLELSVVLGSAEGGVSWGGFGLGGFSEGPFGMLLHQLPTHKLLGSGFLFRTLRALFFAARYSSIGPLPQGPAVEVALAAG